MQNPLDFDRIMEELARRLEAFHINYHIEDNEENDFIS